MVENQGSTTYISGAGHRPLPMAQSVGIRQAHRPQKPKPTGRDWGSPEVPTEPAPDLAPAPVAAAPLVPQEVVTVPQLPPAEFPAYIVEIAVVMRDAEHNTDPAVKAARKRVANALVGLDRALKGRAPKAAPATAPTKSSEPAKPKRSYRRLTTEQVAEICVRYHAGESSYELATAFGVAASSITNKLRAAGVTIRPTHGAAS